MVSHRQCPGDGLSSCFGVTLSWRHTLCSNCLEQFGNTRGEWPDWLYIRAAGIQDETNQDRRHDELEYFDEYPDASTHLGERGHFILVSASDDDPMDSGTIGGQHYDASMGWGSYSDVD